MNVIPKDRLAILQFNVATGGTPFRVVMPTVLQRRSTMMKLAFLASLLGSAAAFAPATQGGKCFPAFRWVGDERKLARVNFRFYSRLAVTPFSLS